jgi:regulator of replication initiation timing
MSNRDLYVRRLKAKLDEWHSEIDMIQSKVMQAGVESKTELEKRLADLKAKRKDVEEKVLNLDQAGESAWEDTKQGVENSWEIFKAGFAKVKSEFERGYEEGKKG